MKMTPVGSLETVRGVWEKVIDQVLDQDLALGVYASTPLRADSGDNLSHSSPGWPGRWDGELP